MYIHNLRLILGVLTLDRIVKSFARNPQPLCYLTTYSNVLTLFGLYTVIAKTHNKNTICGISSINFAMMTAFWTIYNVQGKKSLYGKYKPSMYEVWSDHFIIPCTGLFVCYYNECNKNFHKSLQSMIMFASLWFIITFLNADQPVYPVIKDANGKLHMKRFIQLFIGFFSVGVAFMYLLVSYGSNSKNLKIESRS